MDNKKIASQLLFMAKEVLGIDFATQDEYDKYLKDHPDANRSNHRVVENKRQPVKKDEPKKEESESFSLKSELLKKFNEDDLRPVEKDHKRVSDIVDKATSSFKVTVSKVKSLTENMANKITDPAKAYRRAEAFEDYMAMYRSRMKPELYAKMKAIPEIFRDRCVELVKSKK